MNPIIQQQVRNHAFQNINEECCGLIVGEGDNSYSLPCRNTSLEKDKFYSIDPIDYIKHADKNIIGVYHSHTKGKAEISYLDILNAENHKLDMLIYSIRTDKFLQYKPNGFKCEYIGREFSIGKNDCFTIIKEYYKKELNININDYYRNSLWYEQEPDIYEKNFSKEGFLIVDVLQKHDVILFKFGNAIHANHAAIYIGNDLMLNHCRDKFSTIEAYDKIHNRYASQYLRHKSLC